MTRPGTPIDAGAVILAGGESRRMGANKCMLPYQGRPLIQHVAEQLEPLFQEVRVSTNTPETYRFLDLAIVADETPGAGPLMGVCSALATARQPWTFIVAADIPEIPVKLVRELARARDDVLIVVPEDSSGRYQPLFAFYHRELVPEIRDLLAAGHRRMYDLLERTPLRSVPIETGLLRNLNTPEDYHDPAGAG